MKFRKKYTYVKMLALTSLTVMGALMIAPAQAQADHPKCRINSFCLFEDINFLGGKAVFRERDSDLINNRYSNKHGVNDSASSMINNTGKTIVLYRHSNYRDVVYYAAPESEDRTFRNNDCNDNVSSLSFR